MVDANDDGATLATAATASTLPGTNGDYLSTGHYVTMEISHLPLSALHQRIHDMEASGFLSLFSLLQHEYKLSLLHFTLQRSGDTERVIRSKDQLIFEVLSPLSCHLSSLPPSLSLSASLSHMSPLWPFLSLVQTPFRQFEGKAIFSESNLNCDKHKMERFFKVSPLRLPCPVLSSRL
jgi:pre-rRNA-processing protein TSR1